ncbi:N-6 DNA methylase [Robertmurraya korlensis]|uniref:N-6 DNA methylase n=1 Tax=Robertmurraya korlensis TaxID=519977 RepID=UPI000825705E|nr:N-6 DNA methylase [Robertmurraya korlensis]
MSITNYNERSWAIDVISEINIWATNRNVTIKRGGGENTLSTGRTNLFPDVLIFGDNHSSLILQGWELKLPDTPIDDTELINNARIKADALGTNSFLLWNVTTAVLYVIDENGNNQILHTWNDLNHITRRNQVFQSRDEWKAQLHRMLDDINFYLNEGSIKSTTLIEALTGNGISTVTLDNAEVVADNMRQVARTNTEFRDQVTLWWRGNRQEYLDYREPWIPLAKIALITWANKLIFAHILKQFRHEATEINNISGDNFTIHDATEIITSISRSCDFWNIFQPQLGEAFIDNNTWGRIVQFNEFLTDLRLEEVSTTLIQDLLQNTVYRTQRKVSGQFHTPKELAALLTALTIRDTTANVIDPCCGTGTISKSAYNLKVNSGLTQRQAISTTWASDKFSFPIQMATLAMTTPENTGEILRIFKEDAINLVSGYQVNLFSPNDGSPVVETLPVMDSIVSNLPFVQQEDLKVLNPTIINDINNLISQIAQEPLELDGKSDLYAYLPFSLWGLLNENGRIGLIISNSWLSTKWGIKFRTILNRFFNIECVVTSGNGRWFDNAEVVTNILVLKKRSLEEVQQNTQNENETTSFVVLQNNIEETTTTDSNIDYNKINELTALIRGNIQEPSDFLLTQYTPPEIEGISNLGLGLNALFTDCKWLISIGEKLVSASDFFDIKRGERRGWDRLFYPEAGHGIEEKFIEPVLLNSRQITGLTAVATDEAFCCSDSLETLQENNDLRAYNWIMRFANQVNGKGEPLPQVLSRPNIEWYTMSPSTLADMVISMNPYHRLFVAKLEQRSFVNQRLIRFTKKRSTINVDLCHALLNSVIGLFYIEAIGFGRGLGALDLSATNIKNSLFMLNPALINEEQTRNILTKFNILKQRDVLPIAQELEQQDRNEFDDAVLEAFGISEYKEQIKQSLIQLYNIRLSARRE